MFLIDAYRMRCCFLRRASDSSSQQSFFFLRVPTKVRKRNQKNVFSQLRLLLSRLNETQCMFAEDKLPPHEKQSKKEERNFCWLVRVLVEKLKQRQRQRKEKNRNGGRTSTSLFSETTPQLNLYVLCFLHLHCDLMYSFFVWTQIY